MNFIFEDINGLKKCYHYTSLKACYDIINTNDLWMSDIRYLNDYQEIISCKNRALHKIDRNRRKRIGNEDADLFDYYAISFSRRDDSLSQWRNYADDNHGVCIEFDLTKDGLFKTLLENGNLMLQQILYDKEKVNKIIENCYQIAGIICDKRFPSDFLRTRKNIDIECPKDSLLSILT